MIKIENFQWNDIVLYSKGWYKSTGDIFKDIEISIRQNNNYSFQKKEMRQEEIINWLFKVLDEVYEHLSPIEKENRCWLTKHYDFYGEVLHRKQLFDITINEAIVLTILNIFLNMSNKQIKLNKPVYGKGKRRLGNSFGYVYPISMTYKHMNDIASKMFDK